MRILLLVSAFNGLTQRIWDELRSRDHQVSVELSLGGHDLTESVHAAQPDLILCPFLKERVPAEIWRKWPTVIIHPGPPGDQGPSSLDRAIMDGAPSWGVTALQAVEEFDAGPIWAHRTFPMPSEPPRKSALYNGQITEAAVACALEVVQHAQNPEFHPVPLAEIRRPIPGTSFRPVLKQEARSFDWADDAVDIVRRIRAADGWPGVRTVIAGQDVYAFDASTASTASADAPSGTPGQIIGQRAGHLLVAAGRGSVWIGQLRKPGGVKLPATTVVPSEAPRMQEGPDEICYRRRGPVGELTFQFYNGAAGTQQCHRLTAALRHAAQQDTKVLVLRGSHQVFCNGIHLGEIEAAEDPAGAAWDNIRAINAACRALIESPGQLTIAAFTGNAGAGGVMMALGADVVVAREGVILNPYYDIGLYGSELHTFTLPHRIGPERAAALLDEKLPIGTSRALGLGLVDIVGPGEPEVFDGWLSALAARYAEPAALRSVADAQKLAERPLDYYEVSELAEMAKDLFDDRSGFTAARSAFIHKLRPPGTPGRLRL
ncbi:enoyl-CoA hydratase-related protein [Longispora albida]|uniref:enoyl-CoA hydratase-related protein n=1 Tax=Longispora albida TaxID=203523 RepID=UPI0004754BC6|nr:enoyl-CoA hydratase-related protein [Longispora albida]